MGKTPNPHFSGDFHTLPGRYLFQSESFVVQSVNGNGSVAHHAKFGFSNAQVVDWIS